MIDLTLKRPLSHAVPRHWEYLAVEWGSGSEGQTDIIGAAHAVENATKITPDFCLDVVAGMLDVVRTVRTGVFVDFYDFIIIFYLSCFTKKPYLSYFLSYFSHFFV